MQKRFKCNSCFRNCETTHNIVCEGTAPGRCLEDKSVRCTWIPVEDPNPPKLTQDIFETEECPAWAEYAAVDAYGTARFYSSEPVTDLFTGAWYLPIEAAQAKPYRGNKFDADTWTNSLMKRESKKPELPDWVYNAEYGYHQDYGYVRLDEILEWETKITIVATGETRYVWNGAFSNGRIEEATRSQFSASVMKQLVGKVLVNPKGARYLITYAEGDGSIIECGYDIAYTAEDLMNNGFTIDGKPCFVLEH